MCLVGRERGTGPGINVSDCTFVVAQPSFTRVYPPRGCDPTRYPGHPLADSPCDSLPPETHPGSDGAAARGMVARDDYWSGAVLRHNVMLTARLCDALSSFARPGSSVWSRWLIPGRRWSAASHLVSGRRPQPWLSRSS